jgi:hypothetical protein
VTAVFLTVDPDVGITQQPYDYAGQDPVDQTDLTGMAACVASKKVCDEKPPYPWISPSHPLGPHYGTVQLRRYGATSAEIYIISHESSGYTHAWNYILTTSGYAFGLGQVTGAFRLSHFGALWESATRRYRSRRCKPTSALMRAAQYCTGIGNRKVHHLRRC